MEKIDIIHITSSFEENHSAIEDVLDLSYIDNPVIMSLETFKALKGDI